MPKPSSNKLEAKRFLAKYSNLYFIDGIRLPPNFELKINKKKTAIRLIDKTDFNHPRIAYAVDIEVTDEKINHTSCTQVIVWASPESEELLIGFPTIPSPKIMQHFHESCQVLRPEKVGHLLKTALHLSRGN